MALFPPSSPRPSRPLRPPLPRSSPSALASRRALTSASTAPPGPPSPVQRRRLSYLEAATCQKRPAVLHATPCRGAESPARKAPRRSPLAATVVRRAAAGAFNPVATTRDVSVFVLHPASPPRPTPTSASSASRSPRKPAAPHRSAAPSRSAAPQTAKAQPSSAPQAAKAARTNNRKKKKKKPSSSTKSAVPAPSNTKTNKKKITTRQQNISTVISNEINQWARSDATFDVELENDFTEQEFVTWESGFKKQIAWRFKRTQVTAADHVASLGLGLRSDARDDLLIDEDARLCNVTDQRRLSRCHFEDLLRLQSGARLVLYLKTNSRSTNVCPSLVLKPFDGKLWDAAQLQRDASVGGDITTLAGKKYVVLKTTMLHARSHHDAVSGDVSLSQVQKRFFAKEGFTLKHDGTESTLTLSWQQVIALSEDLLIFGPPLDGTRQYRRCFKGKGESYCKRVYKNLAKETLGDVLTSSALTMAYQEKMIEFREKEIARLRLAKDVVAFNDTKHGERFIRVWDNMCQRRLTSAVTGFNDYNRPLIDLETVDDFVDTAARVFPSLWLHLCNLRGVDGNRHKGDSVNIQRRKRQVLLQLMVLKRMRNFRALKWWSVIQGIGYTGWGVGSTAINAIKTFGSVCSSKTRTRAVAVLCSKLVQRQTSLFSREAAITFVIDNYGETVKLLHQRGERSATRLSGTHEMAIKVNQYTDTKHDHVKCEVKYVVDQDYPSPVLMANYDADHSSGMSDATFYQTHASRAPASAPCSTGARVRAYIARRDDSTWIYEMGDVFSSDNKTQPDQLCSTLDRETVLEFQELASESDVKKIVEAARDMQKQSRRIWNPHGDDVTLTNYMGLVTMDEDTTRENGALGLDVAAKCGLLVKNGSGQWSLADDADTRRVYFVGDAKTADLFEKCIHNLENNPTIASDQDKFAELDTFVNTMKKMIVKPGDWHAGLTMLQAIMNTFGMASSSL